MSIGYGRKPLVRVPDMKIEAGEIISITGPNGSGKSTLLRTLSCLLPPVSGDIVFSAKDGRMLSLSSVDRRSASMNIAALFTDRIRGNGLRCYDLTAAGRYPYSGFFGKLGDKDQDIINEAMELTETTDLSERLFDSLSDGQKQRVLLSRCLCQKPLYLLLDEPTAFLDLRYQYLLRRILSVLSDRGVTVIMSIHELSLASECSSRLITIDSSHLSSIRDPESLKDMDFVKKLFGISSSLI